MNAKLQVTHSVVCILASKVIGHACVLILSLPRNHSSEGSPCKLVILVIMSCSATFSCLKV